MRSRTAHLLIGLMLLGMGGYFLRSAMQGWKPMWRRSTTTAPRPAASPTAAETDPQTADPALDPAKPQVYGILAASGAASKGDAAARAPAATPYMEPVNRAPSAGPYHFLHKRFALNTYQGFAFDVPAHAIHAKLHGGFKSAPDVEVMLLDQQQLDQLTHGEPGSVTASSDPSDGTDVDWALRSSISGPLRYYLVFHDASPHPRTKLVFADFTVSSE